ncbi:hypothetical protein [Caproicibacterium sp. BJN0003]|uniref:hypothetical protein n=1 Tax=Caproicibacterium sp. BJN0003 TaxID=2994078 RepID=UPI0022541966|nr:hypothetical protein [Caproicibacterium sp. BJN0003]UZT82118.1 hypothetical protein OP489_11730 [Caproicibacterium sp. BJN0003]
MSEQKNTALNATNIQSGKEKPSEPTLPHSIKKSKISLEDCPENYINMTKALLKLIEVVSCFDGKVTSSRMEQSTEPYATVECLIDGHAYSVDFSKKLEF